MISPPETFGSYGAWLGAFKRAFYNAYSDARDSVAGQGGPPRAVPGFHVCLAGGRTPAPLYSALAADPDLAALSESLGLHVWVGDERQVDQDSLLRNSRMIELAFGPAGSWPRPPVIHPWPSGEADAACASYLAEIRAALGPGPPGFDLEVLGLGSDGHTAGIFSLDSLGGHGACAPTWAPSEPRSRMSLFPPILASAPYILVPVRGPDKAPILAELSAGLDCPFARVLGSRGRILYLPEPEGRTA
ncbi:MAG TPA: 6-phosphogluconolactonase [Rectinemataceae bacterium]